MAGLAAPESMAPPGAHTTASAVLGTLRERIVRGEWRPGRRLSENDIARELGVSRTPIREAFIRLKGEGLVVVRPQNGTFVAAINLAEVEDSQFLRETVECRTIALAAERCTADDLGRLLACIDVQRRAIGAGDEAGFIAADDAMHRYLIGLSGRGSLWRTVYGAKLQLDRVRHLSLQDRAWTEGNIREHEAIVDRVAACDPTGAEAAMRRHLRKVFATIERISKTHGDYFEQVRRPAPPDA